MKPYWNEELWRLAGVIVAGLLAGLVTGHLWQVFSLAILAYLLWQLRNLYLLNKWLETGVKLSQAPEAYGAWDNIVRQVYRLKSSRKQSKKKLAKMLGQFTKSAAALPDATVILNFNGEIQWFNNAASRYLGLQSPRDIGQRISNLVRSPEFHEFITGNFKDQKLTLVSPSDPNIQLRIRVVKYGRESLLLTARDISEQERLNLVRQQFVSNASHELRTPLTVIRGYIELMENDRNCSEETLNNLAIVHNQTARMEEIIKDMLMLSRLEHTHLSSKEGEPVSVASIIEQLADDAVNAGLAVDGQITVNCDQELCLKAVVPEITSVCSNLLHNALQHNPVGTPVEISWQVDSKGVPALVVKDRGEGIDAVHIPRITERFYRVDSSRSRDSGGTGLGLSIVKHIVQRHDGILDIFSRPGEGTTVSCTFDRARALTCQGR
jgi:two-component system phosphate regulon sensor histidine kinase PhoR